jgi:hypothetical protein
VLGQHLEEVDLFGGLDRQSLGGNINGRRRPQASSTN